MIDKIYFDFIPGTVSTAWIGNREEENKFCQSLCDTCGCVGFGCGDECLCECQQTEADDKCNLVMVKMSSMWLGLFIKLPRENLLNFFEKKN